MKTVPIAFVAALLVLGLGIMTGFVGLHYPRVVENQPLRHPVSVAKIEGSVLTLGDGRIFELEDVAPKGDWKSFLVVGSNVDVEDAGSGDAIIWGNKPGWICGTPWAQPIRIPVFADTVYRNRREMLSYATPNAEHVVGGNGE